jgi:tRNA1(Val) A37 N6-methylase TrmN6
MFFGKNKAVTFSYDDGVMQDIRLAELFAKANRHTLEPKRLCLLRHKENGPVSLVLVQCRKGAKPGLLWEEAVLFDQAGQPTEYYKGIYHL